MKCWRNACCNRDLNIDQNNCDSGIFSHNQAALAGRCVCSQFWTAPSVCSLLRPGRPAPIRPTSRARPQGGRAIRATSHTTRATARRGKMWGSPPRRTLADSGWPRRARAPPSAKDPRDGTRPTSAARLQPWEALGVESLSYTQDFFAGHTQAFYSRNKKKNKKINNYRKWGFGSWTRIESWRIFAC